MASKTIRILLVEDQPEYAQAIKEFLSPSPCFHITHATTFKDALASLERESFEVALLDLTLPDSDGLKTFSDLHEAAPHLPIVVITGVADHTVALKAVREGAQDYLVKGQLDPKTLERSIRYAFERNRAEMELRRKDEMFRLISENVSDLIAVVDNEGRRIYNSPSYRTILGEPTALTGTDSFEEVHPEDRERIRRVFQETLKSGRGARAEYRMRTKDGGVRHIESHGNVIRNGSKNKSNVVVVSRDITERKAAVESLRDALADLKRAHEELKATQLKLVQAEKVEAVGTFAAGVAHEVKNPLQTLLMGLEYLGQHVPAKDNTVKSVVQEMIHAVKRADAIVRGLSDFAQHTRRELRDEDLSAILKQAVAAVEHEMTQHPILLSRELAENLPRVTLDFRSMKHVFINLMMRVVRELQPEGGRIVVRTFATTLDKPLVLNGKPMRNFQPDDTAVWAEVEVFPNRLSDTRPTASPATAAGLGLTVLKKIIELYGGVVETTYPADTGGTRYAVIFKAAKAAAHPAPNPS